MDTDPSFDCLASFQAPASMDHWEEFNAFVETQADRHLGPGKQSYNLRLACEELISNIIRHAGDAGSGPSVTLELRSFLSMRDREQTDLIVELTDNGPFFDPCFETERRIDKELAAADRPIGGLGLFLVQQSVDQAHYSRNADKNRYRLTVHLHRSQSP